MFPVAALHRFSTLPPYTIEQPVVFPSIDPAQCLVHDASFIPNVPSKKLYINAPLRGVGETMRSLPSRVVTSGSILGLVQGGVNTKVFVCRFAVPTTKAD
jgi:hypothetical protein